MTELTRTLRFCPAGNPTAPRHNAFAAWPPPPVGKLAGVLELRVTLVGDVNPVTGLLVNVREVDHVFATAVLPGLRPEAGPADALLVAAEAFEAQMPVARLSLHTSPASSITLDLEHMSRVILRQRYAFSAAHRLHARSLSEDQNEALFGKCSRATFHGHNYTVEVAAEAAVDPQGGSLDPAGLDAVVHQRVIEPLDHRNLNTDVPDFAERNPTVEHIAESCFNRIEGHLPTGAKLLEVTVWETDRTACTYRR